jgi:hypothetical protein
MVCTNDTEEQVFYIGKGGNYSLEEVPIAFQGSTNWTPLCLNMPSSYTIGNTGEKSVVKSGSGERWL